MSGLSPTGMKSQKVSKSAKRNARRLRTALKADDGEGADGRSTTTGGDVCCLEEEEESEDEVVRLCRDIFKDGWTPSRSDDVIADTRITDQTGSSASSHWNLDAPPFLPDDDFRIGVDSRGEGTIILKGSGIDRDAFMRATVLAGWKSGCMICGFGDNKFADDFCMSCGSRLDLPSPVPPDSDEDGDEDEDKISCFLPTILENNEDEEDEEERGKPGSVIPTRTRIQRGDTNWSQDIASGSSCSGEFFDLDKLKMGMKIQAMYSDGKFYPATVVAISKSRKRAKKPVKVHFIGYMDWDNVWVRLQDLKSRQ